MSDFEIPHDKKIRDNLICKAEQIKRRPYRKWNTQFGMIASLGGVIIIPMLLGFALMLSQSWELNVMSFGDDEARSLGVNTRRARIVVILGATLVTGTSVAVSGIIGWVGLVIPHFARAVVGPNYRVLLPACVVLGSAYLLVVDDLARMLIPGANIPIGILTAVLGVPLFLVIFRRTSRGW